MIRCGIAQSTLRNLAIVAGALLSNLSCATAYECTQANYTAARSRMEFAFGAGIIRRDPDMPGGSVFLSEALWQRLNFAEKTLFFEEFVCAIAGVGKSLTEYRFRSDMTGRIIGHWNYGKITVP